MKLYRHIAAALLLAGTSLGTAAAVMTPEQAQYVRMHQTTTAFINTVQLNAQSQGALRDINLDQPRALLDLSEQAAQQDDFAQAGLRARAAYELLRNSIMESVARSQAANRPVGK